MQYLITNLCLRKRRNLRFRSGRYVRDRASRKVVAVGGITCRIIEQILRARRIREPPIIERHIDVCRDRWISAQRETRAQEIPHQLGDPRKASIDPTNHRTPP